MTLLNTRPDFSHSKAKSFSSSIGTDSAPHPSVSQSSTTRPEASNIGATRLQDTKTRKKRKRGSCLTSIYRAFGNILANWRSKRRKTVKDSKHLNAVDYNVTPDQEQHVQETIFDTPEAPANIPLNPTLDESRVPDSGPTQMEESLSSYSSSAPHKPQNERLGERSETSQILASQASLQPDVAEQTTSTEDVNPVRPAVYTVGIEDPQGQLQTAPETSLDVGSVDPKSKFKTQFKMVIHAPQDSFRTRIAKLDTASDVNVVSQDVVDELGITMNPYSGSKVTPVGEPIMPIGTVSLEWHIATRKKTYNTEFLVFHADLTKSFDMLLSEVEIARIGFYKNNDEVWHLRTTNE